MASGGVDAAGVALDQEGNVYFGLICANYSNPYRLKDGKPHYDIGSVRGTIQKLSADRMRRETMATGIRVPYGLSFNRHGEWPTADQWTQADVVVFNLWNHNWSDERYRDMDANLARGGGIVALHAGLIADREPEKLARRFGLAAQPRRTKYRHGPVELTWSDSDDGQPIVAGMQSTRFVDETYWPMIGNEKEVTVLATATEEGKPRPMLWTFDAGEGRVFGCVLDHGSIVLYALGAPLSLDWGSLYLPQVVRAYMHNTAVPESNIAPSMGGQPPEGTHGWNQDSPPLDTGNFVWGLGPCAQTQMH